MPRPTHPSDASPSSPSSSRTSTSQPSAPRSGAPAGAVAGALADLARLVVPVECPGCGRLDVRLCGACLASFDGPVRRVEDAAPRLDRLVGPGPLPVWAPAAYAGPVRGVVTAWKDHGRADLTAPLAGVVRRAARETAPALVEATGGERLAVVPVPTRASARRRRGDDLVLRLAAACVEGLRGGQVDAVLVRALAVVRRRADQAGLGARARGGVAGSLAVRRRTAARAPLGWVLVVDDVLTTGGTVAAASDAVVLAGGLPLGALVLAATPPPGRRTSAFPQSREGG
ncbi:ComF family protein [Actinotalea sp. AC32]|nr:ComF family protein [Actinotalea sp. AC32]